MRADDQTDVPGQFEPSSTWRTRYRVSPCPLSSGRWRRIPASNIIARMPTAESTLNREAILSLINEAYAGPAWHGPSVKESLAGVTAVVASRKLAPDRNSTWELVLHLAHGRHLLIE